MDHYTIFTRRTDGNSTADQSVAFFTHLVPQLIALVAVGIFTRQYGYLRNDSAFCYTPLRCSKKILPNCLLLDMIPLKNLGGVRNGIID